MKNSSVNTVKPENINCKVGDFGLSLKLKSTHANGQRYHQDTKLDSMPNEKFPFFIWGPECHWQGGKRYFTEYSDVFTFGMLMWELFRIMGECRTDEKCSGKCQAHKTIKPENFLKSRQEALPVPTLLKMKNDEISNKIAREMKDLKYSETLQRMFKCWEYQSKDNPHQNT